MRVRECMRHPVRSIGPRRTVAEAGDLMEQFGIEHLAVIDGKRLVGVISDDDVCRSAAGEGVEHAMSRRVVTIGPEELISRAANLMRGHSIDSLVVIDEERKPVGIITTTDLLEVISRTGHPERTVLRDRGRRRRPARL